MVIIVIDLNKLSKKKGPGSNAGAFFIRDVYKHLFHNGCRMMIFLFQQIINRNVQRVAYINKFLIFS